MNSFAQFLKKHFGDPLPGDLSIDVRAMIVDLCELDYVSKLGFEFSIWGFVNALIYSVFLIVAAGGAVFGFMRWGFGGAIAGIGLSVLLLILGGGRWEKLRSRSRLRKYLSTEEGRTLLECLRQVPPKFFETCPLPRVRKSDIVGEIVDGLFVAGLFAGALGGLVFGFLRAGNWGAFGCMAICVTLVACLYALCIQMRSRNGGLL